MSADLDVRFEPLRHGWLPFTVAHSKAGEFRESSSFVFRDFLADLISALVAILRGDEESGAVAWLEPDGWCFRFVRRGNVVRFSLEFEENYVGGRYRGGPELLATSGTVGEVCRPFLRGLRELERLTPAGEWERLRGEPFPSALLAEAGRLLRTASPHPG